ncbi:hypothetical protein MNEG_2062 [Monoraphidium neglectum]|uniref:Agd3 deacetylase domain-containing protein n=1 Tax=Monoraphidium neglectum TaxID=145388 RepID=A0A0D2K6B6_9CHLO|nr:hypothetical protein MNEG_2062 [Monoraphidium neglectum]KIZ05898.1 hypothetical protein MNEG_2062 [Monoraphidium neglectum]|eukprot:XP_013904917.1 hypothetical protein MNEG_2062 [Monoraphidium neglectum]
MAQSVVAYATLIVGCLALTAVPGASALVVKLNTLVLTVPGWNIDFLESTLLGYGAPYTVARYDKSNPLNLTQLLWAPDGSANFAGYIMYPNIEAMGHLNSTQVLTIWDYQNRTGSSADVTMKFTAAAPLGASGILPSAPLSSSGLYRCPGSGSAPPLATCSMWASDFAATGLHPPCQSTPVLMVGANVAGTLVKFGDGRESLAFMHDCAGWSTTCLVLGHVSLSWILQGLIPGERISLLTVHFDDFFLATEFDANLKVGSLTQYRATVPDLQAHLTWRSALAASRPGTSITYELPYNGNGVLEQVANTVKTTNVSPIDVDDRSCIDFPEYVTLGCSCWFIGMAACPATQPTFCRNCTKDWAKPLGSGVNRAAQSTKTNNATWNVADFSAGDPLANFIITNTNGQADGFFYDHHTFSHENLDNATSFDTDIQIELNMQMASYLSLASRKSYSSKCMVTPQISGLRNGDALASLARHGVVCGTGDNTWPFLMNTNNPHHMLLTNKATNGFDGFEILPRFATEIYYNCSTPTQNMVLYNNLYRSFFGGDSTIADLMQREAARVSRELFKLRHDPYMMHQANLAILDGSGKSLSMRWVDAVVAEFGKYASWPLTSLKLDDLRAAFLARQARDACALSYAIEVGANRTVTAVTVKSGAAADGTQCSAPLIMGGSSTSTSVAKGGSVRVQPAGLSWFVPQPA